MLTPHDDVIAAIATPIGEGGISVVRVSGTGAMSLVDKNFRGRRVLASAATHTAHFGSFVDSKENVVDEVVVTVFREPHSYTGKDTVEVSCHGGIFVTSKILESLLCSGARNARPGEFTQRAFLNGRIDLAQAEAVADIIRSKSEAAHRVSVAQLQGTISAKVKEMRLRLLDLCGLLELELDFSEEGIELLDRQRLVCEMKVAISSMEMLIESYTSGKIAREGIKATLAGKPNVGKSSILNCLLNKERAIVTSIPGTTRDTIEESVSLNGILLRITDTAGLRESSDFVEIEGISRSESEIRESDLLLFVVDCSSGVNYEDLFAYQRVKNLVGDKNRILLIFNKIDAASHNTCEVPDMFADIETCSISAKACIGLDQLRSRMLSKVMKNKTSLTDDGSIVITNARQREAIVKAREHLEIALHDLENKLSAEYIAMSIRLAMDCLGDVIGLVTSEDVLDNIFSRFCVGK